MKRACFVLVLLLAVSLPSFAGEFEKAVRARWLGAWVVTNVEAYSDCSTQYTNNRVNGNFVKSSGANRFQPGELLKLDKINAKRSRIDLNFSVAESILIPYEDGPFTLYREAACRLELEVVVPRDVVKAKDVDWVDDALLGILERYANEEVARDSDLWNEREREEYPADYERTLTKHSIWQATQTNDAVQSQIDTAYSETTRLPDRLNTDPVYLDGFVRGVEAAKANELSTCTSLVGFNLVAKPKTVGTPQTPEQTRSKNGFHDGRVLIYALDMIRRLPGCFVDVPELPEETAAATQQGTSTAGFARLKK